MTVRETLVCKREPKNFRLICCGCEKRRNYHMLWVCSLFLRWGSTQSQVWVSSAEYNTHRNYIRCRKNSLWKYFVGLIFVALCDYENFSTTKISRFTVYNNNNNNIWKIAIEQTSVELSHSRPNNNFALWILLSTCSVHAVFQWVKTARRDAWEEIESECRGHISLDLTPASYRCAWLVWCNLVIKLVKFFV